jgi:hypothetical protein
MSVETVTGALAADVATGGTFTVGYPTVNGRTATRGRYSLGVKHKLSVIGKVFVAPEDMTLSFGASSVTVTYNGATTLPAGSRFTFEFDRQGEANPVDFRGRSMYTPASAAVLNLGSPGTADADGYCASQSISSTATINGALASGGVGFADCPTGRNVVAAWTNTAVMTVTGTDMYGNTIVESSGSGTSLTGKKAFRTVTSVSVSAAVTGATVGTGDVIGLPVYLPSSGYVVREMEDGATASSGTIVAGLSVNTKSTATTADVRGTYDPNSACDGSKAFTLLAILPDPSFRGNDQFAG